MRIAKLAAALRRRKADQHTLRSLEAYFQAHPDSYGVFFDVSYYCTGQNEVSGRMSPLEHFVRYGSKAGQSPSAVFDTAYYLAENPDVRQSGVNPLLHYLTSGWKEDRNPSPLFDAAYYLAENPDVRESGVNPLVHYITSGWKNGKNPSPLFDAAYYLAENPDVQSIGINPLVHYLTFGWKEGRNPSPLFDTAYYLAENPDVQSIGINPLVHYLTSGWKEGRNPSPLFDAAYYLAENPDVRETGVNPLVHYLTSGWKEGRNPSRFFDGAYYLEENPEVRKSGVSPLTHYVTAGWREGRNPSAFFDTDYYLTQNPDVRESGTNPLAHYLTAGWKTRNPSVYFDADYYYDLYPDVLTANLNPLEHFLTYGCRENRKPSPVFDTEYYLAQNPDVEESGINPLKHYVTLGWKEGRSPSRKYVLSLFTNGQNPAGYTVDPVKTFLLHGTESEWLRVHVPSVPAEDSFKLILTMSYGGGTEVYVRNVLLNRENAAEPIFYVKYMFQEEHVLLEVIRNGETEKKIVFLEVEHLLHALSGANLSCIIVNNLVSWPSAAQVLRFIAEYKKSHADCFVEVKGHDFYSVCPSYTLLDQDEKYCGVRCDEEGCRNCLNAVSPTLVSQSKETKHNFSIIAWRKLWGSFYLDATDRLTVFSEASKAVFLRAYPGIHEKVIVVPHEIPPFRMCNVVVLGHLSVQKGSNVVRTLCDYLDENNLDDMHIYLFGVNSDGIQSRHFTEKGPYLRGNLPQLLRQIQADIVLIPSICVETFCYTAGEALSLGYPVACFDLGGQADQVRKSDRGVLLNRTEPSYLYEVLRQFGTDTAAAADAHGESDGGGSSVRKETVVVQDKRSQEYLRYLFSYRDDKSAFVPEQSEPIRMNADMPKVLAFYLPQFHEFEENTRWFGRGFTEWTNTSRTMPQFTGHTQPQIPIDVGYYNLDSTAIMHRQAELAKKYGISGFCVYYYWFSGQKLMEKPMQRLLEDQTLDFPFFFFWANEDWTRLWGDGGDREVLYKAELLEDDAEKFMADALPYMRDARYIKIRNKPMLIIYKMKVFPKEKYLRFVRRIREIAKENGFDGLYISSIVEDWMDGVHLEDIQKEYDLDAITEFSSTFGRHGLHVKAQQFIDPNCRSYCYDVANYIHSKAFLRKTNANVFAGLFTNWDNSPRRYNRGGSILQNTPEDYKLWLSELIRWTKQHHSQEEQFIFVNAWNEWAESAHLEPDTHFGYSFLQKTREALEESCEGAGQKE